MEYNELSLVVVNRDSLKLFEKIVCGNKQKWDEFFILYDIRVSS